MRSHDTAVQLCTSKQCLWHVLFVLRREKLKEKRERKDDKIKSVEYYKFILKQFRHSRHSNTTNSLTLRRVKSLRVVDNTNLIPNHPPG